MVTVTDEGMQLGERESKAVAHFMMQMDREHRPNNVFPVSAQERLYWALGGPEWNNALPAALRAASADA